MKEFIEKFADALEIEAVETLSAETVLHELDEWSSLVALTVIAMVDEEYDVCINGQDIRSSDTIEDLFNIICSKK